MISILSHCEENLDVFSVYGLIRAIVDKNSCRNSAVVVRFWSDQHRISEDIIVI